MNWSTTTSPEKQPYSKRAYLFFGLLFLSCVTAILWNFKPKSIENSLVDIEKMNVELVQKTGWDLLDEMSRAEHIFENDTLIYNKLLEEITLGKSNYYLQETQLRNQVPVLKNAQGTILPPDSVMHVLATIFAQNIQLDDCQKFQQDSSCLARKELVHILTDWNQYHCSFRFYMNRIDQYRKNYPMPEEDFHYLRLYSMYLGKAKVAVENYLYENEPYINRSHP